MNADQDAALMGRLRERAPMGFLVLGRVGMDLTPKPAGTPIAEAVDMGVSMGGSSANIAAGLVKLGAPASLVTCVSDDAVGWYCLGQLDHYGIDRSHLRKVKGEERTSLAVVETRMEDHQSVIYRNNAADFQMNTADIEAIDFAKYGALITTGTVFAAEPSRSAAFLALDKARAAGLPVIFDIDYRPYSWPSAEVAQEVLTRAGHLSDMIVGNDEEFGFMVGDYDKGLAAARQLAGDAPRIIIYKKGPEGAITLSGGAEIATGIFPVTALKPTGAGDSFMAGLLASICAGCDLETAVLRGSACASIVVAKAGCAPAMPIPSELETFLNEHPGASAP